MRVLQNVQAVNFVLKVRNLKNILQYRKEYDIISIHTIAHNKNYVQLKGGKIR